MNYIWPKKFSAKIIFLMRRRLDGLLFSLAAFMFLLPTPTSAILFGVFLCMGIYLLAFRPRRSLTHLDKQYVVATLIFTGLSFAINLANGSLPADMRWSSYPVYYLFVIPIAVGLVLVRDPLRQFVIGTRAALVALTLWALIDLAMHSGRPGFGANPANAAFALTFLAVVSRLNVNSPPRLLANRHVFFYLGLFAVLASQTRALLPVFAAGILFDLFGLLRNRASTRILGDRRSIGLAAIAVAFVVASISLIYPFYAERIAYTFDEVSHVVHNSDAENASGLSIRFGQWRAAASLIAENPLLGRGGAGVSEEIVKHAPPGLGQNFSQFTFVHNFILDEAIQRGLAGVALLLAYFGFNFFRIYKYGDKSVKENVLLILTLTLSFGLLHYLLVIDRHVILYALYFLLLTTANRGWRPPYNPRMLGEKSF